MSPQPEAEIQRESQKGCGMIVLVACLVGAGFFLLPKSALGTTMVPELIGITMIVAAIQLVSKRIAQARLHLARAPFETGDYAAVQRLLEPYLGRSLLWPNARFDRSGEALYLLAYSFAKLGEPQKAAQVVHYLRRYRKGEWVEKAGLIPLERR